MKAAITAANSLNSLHGTIAIAQRVPAAVVQRPAQYISQASVVLVFWFFLFVPGFSLGYKYCTCTRKH